MNPDRLKIFFDRFPLLKPTLEKLNGANIPFAIGGSGCLFLLGNERLPDDVDMYLPNDRHDEADRLFGIESYTYRSPVEEVRNSNPGGDHSMQLTSRLVITTNGTPHDLSLTDDVIEARLSEVYDGQTIYLYPPEDVLLIKALLQRGADVGKHDLEDIQTFLAIYPNIRRDYLSSRIKTIGAEQRVGSIFA